MLIDPSPIDINQINSPIPPSPRSEPWKRIIKTNPMMPRMIPADNKIIPTILLIFKGSISAIASDPKKIPNAIKEILRTIV
jgi:hypothetical protein